MFTFDPNPTNIPDSVKAPAEYSSWLSRTFPDVVASSGSSSSSSSSSSTSGNSLLFNNNNSNNTGSPSSGISSAVSFSSSSSTNNGNNSFHAGASGGALMVIPTATSASDPNSPKNRTSSGTVPSSGLTTQELHQQSAKGGSLVIINNRAVDEAERIRSGGGGGGSGNQEVIKSHRAINVDDFNAAYKKQQAERQKQVAQLKQQQEARKKKEEQDQERLRQVQQDQDKFQPHRRSRERDDNNNNHQQQQQNQQQEQKQNQKAKFSQQQQQQQEEQEEGEKEKFPAGSVTAALDHLGRSFLHCPAAVAQSEISSSSNAANSKIPSKMAFAYKNSGSINQILTWVPPHGHLFVAGDISGNCTMYEALTENFVSKPPRLEKLATYTGHRPGFGVKEIAFPASDTQRSSSSPSGALGSQNDKFLSAAPDCDFPLNLWNTETAQCLVTFRLPSGISHYSKFVRAAGSQACVFVPPAVCNGATRGDTLCVSGMGSVIVVWDTRSGARVMDLEAHLQPVSFLNFAQGGRGLFSCGEDKTVRLWDLRSTSAVQEFSEATMQSISHLVEHPASGDVFCQSNDNTIRCLQPQRKRGNLSRLDATTVKYRFSKDRVFAGGHTISGTSCRLALSRTDGGKLISTGDVQGNLWIYSTSGGGSSENQNQNNNSATSAASSSSSSSSAAVVKKFRAHGKELTVHQWHPVVSGLMVTAGRDGRLCAWK